MILLPLPDFGRMARTLKRGASSAEASDDTEGDELVGDIAAAADDADAVVDEKEEKEENGDEGDQSFTAAEDAVGSMFISAIVEIDRALRAARARTPSPEWAKDERYELAEERQIRIEIDRLTTEIKALEASHSKMIESLSAAGELRGLLFETGHQLEEAILQALRMLGFSAQRFRDGDSEFDAVFLSAEGGRFLGEAEGKDTKAVNIDKMDQLERNIREEFSIREGTEYAKGVLFGNANRFVRPSEREEFFTAKCKSAAARSGVALVQTPDLFDAARYLKEHPDEQFARACRNAILNTSGEIVHFPEIPTVSGSEEGPGA